MQLIYVKSLWYEYVYYVQRNNICLAYSLYSIHVVLQDTSKYLTHYTL